MTTDLDLLPLVKCLLQAHKQPWLSNMHLVNATCYTNDIFEDWLLHSVVQQNRGLLTQGCLWRMEIFGSMMIIELTDKRKKNHSILAVFIMTKNF